MERFKKYDPQCKEVDIEKISLLPNDRIVLDVRKKKLGVARTCGSFQTSVIVYDLNSIDCSLELFDQLKRAKKEGVLKHVKII